MERTRAMARDAALGALNRITALSAVGAFAGGCVRRDRRGDHPRDHLRNVLRVDIDFNVDLFHVLDVIQLFRQPPAFKWRQLVLVRQWRGRLGRLALTVPDTLLWHATRGAGAVT